MMILWGIKNEDVNNDNPALYERPLLTNGGNLSRLSEVLKLATAEGWGSFRRSFGNTTRMPIPRGSEFAGFDWR